MTKRDFEAIARAFRDLGESTHNWQAVSLSVNALLPVLAGSNPRFDQDRFIAACGLGKE